MSVLILLFGAVGLGFVLIFLIAAFSPRPDGAGSAAGNSAATALDALNGEQMGVLVAELLGKMGLEVDRVQGGGDEVVEIRAKNPAPVVGGELLVHCVPGQKLPSGLNGPRVGAFVRAVRSAYVTKGLLFTSAELTPDGRREAEDAPVEIFDRTAFQRLLDQHLPATSA